MNARENPFAPGRLERVLPFDPELTGTTWEELESRWEKSGYRGVVTGRKGSGKTTLLRAWAKRLEARGIEPLKLFFNDRRRSLQPEDRELLAHVQGRILLIDGEGHLPWSSRRELIRAVRDAQGVLVARWDRGPWKEIVRLTAGPALAEALLKRAAPEWAAHFTPELKRRLAGCEGNLRELWLGIYDDLASVAPLSPPEAPRKRQETKTF